MKKTLLLAALTLCAGSLVAADLKSDVKAAAKKLADSGYTWTTTSEPAAGGGGGGGGAGRMTPGPIEGKAAKDGCVLLSMKRGENTTEAAVKGEKAAVKTEEGWKSAADLAQAPGGGGGGGGGQGNPARFAARTVQNFKAPAVQAAEIADKVKELKKEGDVLTGELTEQGVKELLAFRGGRGGGNAPEVGGAKGTAKFWLKDNALVKYQYHVQGTMTFNNQDREVDRTTTVEIKNVGTTKVEVPEEAKKLL